MISPKELLSDQTVLIKWVFYIFKSFGLSTMALNEKSFGSKNASLYFMRSRRGIFYNAFLMSAVIIFCSVQLQGLPVNGVLGRMSFENVIDSMQGTLNILVCEFILMTFAVCQDKTIYIANKLNLVRELAVALEPVRSDGRRLLEKSLIILVFTNIPVCLLIAIAAPKESYGAIYSDVDIFMCYFVINCLLIQYGIILKFVHLIFRVINASLSDFREMPNAAPEAQSPVDSDEAIVAKLMNLRRLYILTSDTSQDLSDFYSKPVLLCTLHIFTMLILSAYYVTKPIFLELGTLSPVLVAHNFFHLMNMGSTLMILTTTVTDTIKESKKTGKIITSCLENFENKVIRRKLKSFSIYLLHNNVEFTAFDLFPLDKTLLMMIVGSITTYLVIILQFRKINHS